MQVLLPHHPAPGDDAEGGHGLDGAQVMQLDDYGDSRDMVEATLVRIYPNTVRGPARGG